MAAAWLAGNGKSAMIKQSNVQAAAALSAKNNDSNWIADDLCPRDKRMWAAKVCLPIHLSAFGLIVVLLSRPLSWRPRVSAGRFLRARRGGPTLALSAKWIRPSAFH